MLLYYLRELCNGIVLLLLIIMVCAGYAYYVNFKRADDDPNKRNYHPLAIILASFTWPVLLIFFVSIFLMRVFFYGFFLILFTLAVLYARKPFIFKIMASIAKPSPKMG